jgi:hypothetical protein
MIAAQARGLSRCITTTHPRSATLKQIERVVETALRPAGS